KADPASITPSALPGSTPELKEEIHFAEARFEGKGDLHTDPHRHVDIDIDGPPPPTGSDWLSEAANRLASRAYDSPAHVTDAARLLAKEMHEAFLRRWVNEMWIWQSIKNFLTRKKFWPSSRKPRAP